MRERAMSALSSTAMNLDLSALPFGILAALVFLSRLLDVSLGTIRMIATVQGRIVTAFILGLFEVTSWLLVITALVATVTERPWLIVFYAFGFSTGNVLGIILERKIAMGYLVLRFITGIHGLRMVELLRENGFRVTRFEGEGARGPVSELYVVLERKRLASALKLAKSIDKDIFYITESPSSIRRFQNQMATPPGGWRAIMKRR